MPARDEQLAVRPMKVDEYRHVVDYFHDASDALLRQMGAERSLLPDRHTWLEHLRADHTRPPGEADRRWLCWLVDDEPIGHSSLSDIVLGQRATIHLHMWRSGIRRRGLGTELFRQSVAYAFARLELARLYCEPKADNSAPNRVVEKLGFQLVETRWTKPGQITFEQQTNLYVLERR